MHKFDWLRVDCLCGDEQGYWEAMQIDPSVPGFTAMNIALVVLQALHVFWFGLVLQATKSFIAGGGQGSPDDVREDGDEKKD
jgi:hypothetical protein